jgi:ABC-2 type transport system permease protein
MKKLFLIGFKDVKLAFRDRAALLLMLLAPFLLTIGLGFVTGRFSGSSSGLSQIPVILVNQDQAQLGNALVNVFNSTDLADLVDPSEADSPEAARRLIDDDQAAAAVIIPAGFTNSIIPTSSSALPSGEILQIEVYANPNSPVSAGVIQSIVDEFVSRVDIGSVGGQIAITQLLDSGRIGVDQAEAAGRAYGERQIQAASDSPVIGLNTTSAGEEPVEFDVLAFLAPGMALMFLMYTVSHGGRSILMERNQGTLPRLLISPTQAAQVLGGKVVGIFLTGVAQMLVLIGSTSLLFQLHWGDPLAVLVLVLAAVFGATGWGVLLTALARTPAQVSSMGSTIMLIFGLLGGSFISLDGLPAYVQWISKITPNAWGLDGFTLLATGKSLNAITTPILALLVMGAVLFVAAILLFNRQTMLGK